MVQKVAVKLEFEAGLRHAQGRMAAKGEGRAPPFISCAQNTVGI